MHAKVQGALLRQQPRDRLNSTEFLVCTLCAGVDTQQFRAIRALIRPSLNPVMWERRYVSCHVQSAGANPVWLTHSRQCFHRLTIVKIDKKQFGNLGILAVVNFGCGQFCCVTGHACQGALLRQQPRDGLGSTASLVVRFLLANLGNNVEPSVL